MNELLRKKISIGLNLNEPEDDIYSFLETYKDYLSSLYFSLPLGVGFYSRNELAEEYEAEGAEKKLVRKYSLGMRQRLGLVNQLLFIMYL